MCPDVERFVGHLEEAEDAVCGRAARVTVPGHDGVLVEDLQENTLIRAKEVWERKD